MDVNIRAIQRADKPPRTRIVASPLAIFRFETEPGEQLQVYFGTKSVIIGCESKRIFVVVASLGFSRMRSDIHWRKAK
jgi:transposase